MKTGRTCLYLSILFLLPCLDSFARDADPQTALDVHRLMQRLSSDDWILQSEALQRLGRWKIHEAAPEINRLLAEGNTPWLRGQALVALARIRGEAMLPVARRWLQAKEAALRKAAVEALSIIATQEATSAARDLLGDPDPHIRAMAAALCASDYPQEAWRAVRGLAERPDPAISAYLSRALAAIGGDEALAQVEKLFTAAAGNEGLRYQIMRGLHAADETAIPLLVRLMAHYRPGHRAFQFGRNVLASREKQKVVAALQAVFATEETGLYTTAAVLAVDICTSEALEDTIAATWLKHQDLPPGTIRPGLAALAKVDPSRHIALFRHYLDSKDGAIRAMAIRCRALCDKQDLFDEFRKHMADQDRRAVQAALESLRGVPVEVGPAEGIVDYLAGPLRSRDRTVLVAALELMGSRGTEAEFPKALKALGPALGAPDEVLRTDRRRRADKAGWGQERAHVVAAQGYISHWKVMGTFLNDSKGVGFETVYPPEKEVDFSKKYESEYRWEFEGGQHDQLQKIQVKWCDVLVPKVDGVLNVAVAMPLPTRHAVAYAVADIHSDKEQTVRAMVAQEGKVRFWANGKKVARSAPQAAPAGSSIPLESRYSSKVLNFVDGQILGRHDQNRNRILEPVEIARVPWIDDWKQDDANRDGRLTREELARRTARRWSEPGPFKISLKEGQNRILVKTASQGGRWWLSVRLLDEKENRTAWGVTQAPMKQVDAGAEPQSPGAER